MTVYLIILDQEAILDFQFGPDLKNEKFLGHYILDLDNLLFWNFLLYLELLEYIALIVAWVLY